MTTPFPSVAELLALPPGQLAELVDACPGDYVSTRAAVLGLDLDVPEHRHALVAAFPDAFSMLQLDSADTHDHPAPTGESGVRATLTPDREPEPEPGNGHPPAGEPAHSAAEPAGPEPLQIADMLRAYRGRPEPFLVGTFAMYSAPDGSIVIVTDNPDRGVEQHVIPGRFVQLGLTAMEGGGGMLGKLLGR